MSYFGIFYNGIYYVIVDSMKSIYSKEYKIVIEWLKKPEWILV